MSKSLSKSGKKGEKRLLASNKKARHDYEILETMEAGLVLKGTEVKAARSGKVQLKDSYVTVRDGGAWLIGAHISPYSHGNRMNHQPERDRKLLLHKKEIDRIFGRTTQEGQTAVPLDVYLVGHWIKCTVALARGKKLYDKRQAEKDKIAAKEADTAIRERFGR